MVALYYEVHNEITNSVAYGPSDDTANYIVRMRTQEISKREIY